jgi:ribosomal protein L18E
VNLVQIVRWAADNEAMVIPIRILALVLTASALACAAMTLVLIAARAA